MRLPRIWIVRLLAVATATVVALVGLVAIDLYLHARYRDDSGYNVWGYRGPSLPARRANEWRVAMVGGSTVFGYGVRWHESIPVFLESLLRERLAASGTAVAVANLGWMAEGAHAFRFVLRDYAYLGVDTVVLYEGYNDLSDAPNRRLYRQSSPVFRLTGYMPILPLIVQEKATLLAGGQQAVVFDATLARRTGVRALEGAQAVSDALARQLDRLAPDVASDADVSAPAVNDCGRWIDYCASVAAAIDESRAAGRRVLVVSQPRISAAHEEQQAALRRLVGQRYVQDRGVGYLDLSDAIDLRDQQVAYDGMHLVPDGNRRIAAALVEPVLALGGMATP